MYRHLLYVLLILSCFCGHSAQAQLTMDRQVISSGGGQHLSGMLELSHTLGETGARSAVSGVLYLNAGFQQGEPRSPGTNLHEIPTAELPLMSVFPNPTADHLTLQIVDFNHEKLAYQLFDMQGKLLNNEKIVTGQTTLNLSLLPAATYLLHVLNQDNRIIRSFKVIKTQ